jgi:hypothetical protein
MIERGYRTSFTLETFTELSLRDLDGDDAIQPRVTGLVNVTHPTRTDGREYFVRAEFFAGLRRHVTDLA